MPLERSRNSGPLQTSAVRPTSTADWHVATSFDVQHISTSTSRATAAQRELARYARWYDEYVTTYERDRAAHGKAPDQRARSAHQEAAQKLTQLEMLVQITDTAQLQQLTSVLAGFRELAELTTDLPERRILIRRLVDDLPKRLKKLGLIKPAAQAENKPKAPALPPRVAWAA